jgi:hypothetical protein
MTGGIIPNEARGYRHPPNSRNRSMEQPQRFGGCPSGPRRVGYRRLDDSLYDERTATTGPQGVGRLRGEKGRIPESDPAPLLRMPYPATPGRREQ